jgi:hypothetical protein
VTVLQFKAASALLGMGDDTAAGRRLKRLVLAKERQSGVSIAIRGYGTERALRGVTIGAIQQHMPELLPAKFGATPDTRMALVQETRGYLAAFDERAAKIARAEAETAIGELVQPQLDELRTSNDEALELCRDIAKRLSQGATVGANRGHKTTSNGG